VTTSESVLDQHAENFGFHRPHRQDAVVYPTNVDEVASVLGSPAVQPPSTGAFDGLLAGEVGDVNRGTGGLEQPAAGLPDPRGSRDDGEPCSRGRAASRPRSRW
jgi:hypothetical protein